MPHDRIGMAGLLRAGMRRSLWQSGAGLVAAMVAAGALFSALSMLTGMERLLGAGLQRLGADLLLAPRGQGARVEELLRTGFTEPLAATIPVAEWRQKVKAGKVTGVRKMEGWSLVEGGSGMPTGGLASLFLIHLEHWASPLMTAQEVAAAIPEAEVLISEQTTRNVARNLQPVVRLMTLGAAGALLAAVLMTALLTSIRVAERRGELGMLRAVGASRAFMLRLVLAESALLAVFGGTAGILVGWAATGALAGALLRSLSVWEAWSFAVGALVVTVGAAVVAALGPALRTAALDPLEAARQG